LSNYVNETSLFEHRFWLQILGDHSRFILNALSPKESSEIQTAQQFILMFDTLLVKARQSIDPQEILSITTLAYEYTQELRQFKLYLLQRHLIGRIQIGLPPTFLNHMVNEAEEYLRILECLRTNRLPLFDAIHHHLVWLLDASGHAGAIAADLDITEKDFFASSKHFEQRFTDFYNKAIELAGYMRTQLKDFPALARFNHNVELEMLLFQHFLTGIEELRLSDELLGRISPLMPDHMFREECYYLTKLSQVSQVKPPNCDPGKERIES
jgi:hypothetical protein